MWPLFALSLHGMLKFKVQEGSEPALKKQWANLLGNLTMSIPAKPLLLKAMMKSYWKCSELWTPNQPEPKRGTLGVNSLFMTKRSYTMVVQNSCTADSPGWLSISDQDPKSAASNEMHCTSVIGFAKIWALDFLVNLLTCRSWFCLLKPAQMEVNTCPTPPILRCESCSSRWLIGVSAVMIKCCLILTLTFQMYCGVVIAEAEFLQSNRWKGLDIDNTSHHSLSLERKIQDQVS